MVRSKGLLMQAFISWLFAVIVGEEKLQSTAMTVRCSGALLERLGAGKTDKSQLSAVALMMTMTTTTIDDGGGRCGAL